MAKVTIESQPTKFIWAVPSDVKTGCLYAKDTNGNIIAQSEEYTVATKLSKRGYPELAGMYFDAVKYHKERFAKRKNIVADAKSRSRLGVPLFAIG